MDQDRLARLLLGALDRAPEALLVTTSTLAYPGPKIIYANAAFEKMTGHTGPDVIGQVPAILIGEGTDRSVLGRLCECVQAGEQCSGDTINYRKDGTRFGMRWHFSPVLCEEQSIRCFVFIQREIDLATLDSPTERSTDLEAKREFLESAALLLSRFGRDLEGLATSIARDAAPSAAPSGDRLLDSLSDRQREVAAWLLKGWHVDEIAQELGLAVATVRNHRAAIYLKLGVHSQRQLMRKFGSVAAR